MLLWFSCTVAVAAHAYVVGAQPPTDGGNAHPNGWIAVSFDEPIDLIDTNALEVFAPNGKRVDRHDVTVDPNDATRILVHVPHSLESGVYTVRWRVISADSHVVHGSYRIGIGVPVAGAAASEVASPFDPALPLASFLRWLSLLGALLAVGATFLRLYALDKIEDALGGLAISRRCAIAGILIVLAAWVPTVIVQSAAASGTFGNGIAPTLLHTAWGSALLVRALAGLAALLASWLAWRFAGPAVLGFLAILLVTFSVTGHAFAQPAGAARIVAVSVDFAHLSAAAIWIGGLLVLAAMLWRGGRKGVGTGDRQMLFAAFTPAAILSVGVLLATGIYAAAVHIGAPHDIWATAYGRLLLAKTTVFIILLAFGWHHFRVGAGIRSGTHTTIFYEAAWGIIVIALTALLVGQVPPASGLALPQTLGRAILAIVCIGITVRFVLLARVSAVCPPAPSNLDARLAFVGAILLSVGVAGRLVDIRSVAMYPALQLGDVVLVDRVTYRLRPPEDGEIVLLNPPVRSKSLDVPQRVIGVGGDAIEIAGGVVYRNGVALHEPYEFERPAYDLSIRDYEIYVDGAPLDPSLANIPPKVMWQSPNRIPKGFYFMLGDNRNYSLDSHFWGFAQISGAYPSGLLKSQSVTVPAKPIFIVWPLERAGIVETS